MSVGLMGATGTLDFDGLTVDLIPVGGEDSTNLVVNGGFELGDPAPGFVGRRGRRTPRLSRKWLAGGGRANSVTRPGY